VVRIWVARLAPPARRPNGHRDVSRSSRPRRLDGTESIPTSRDFAFRTWTKTRSRSASGGSVTSVCGRERREPGAGSSGFFVREPHGYRVRRRAEGTGPVSQPTTLLRDPPFLPPRPSSAVRKTNAHLPQARSAGAGAGGVRLRAPSRGVPRPRHVRKPQTPSAETVRPVRKTAGGTTSAGGWGGRHGSASPTCRYTCRRSSRDNRGTARPRVAARNTASDVSLCNRLGARADRTSPASSVITEIPRRCFHLSDSAGLFPPPPGGARRATSCFRLVPRDLGFELTAAGTRRAFHGGAVGRASRTPRAPDRRCAPVRPHTIVKRLRRTATAICLRPRHVSLDFRRSSPTATARARGCRSIPAMARLERELDLHAGPPAGAIEDNDADPLSEMKAFERGAADRSTRSTRARSRSLMTSKEELQFGQTRSSTRSTRSCSYNDRGEPAGSTPNCATSIESGRRWA
jgi:hypothetical protein